MRLFCHKCNETHDFDEEDVKRILYAINGQLIDELAQPCGVKYEYPEDADACLQCHLSVSNDGEGYLGYVNSALEASGNWKWDDEKWWHYVPDAELNDAITH